jgi:hypothetical protein
LHGKRTLNGTKKIARLDVASTMCLLHKSMLYLAATRYTLKCGGNGFHNYAFCLTCEEHQFGLFHSVVDADCFYRSDK